MFCFPQDRESQKLQWLQWCVEELRSENEKWVIPALKQMRDICMLYLEVRRLTPSLACSMHEYYPPRYMVYVVFRKRAL